jgi:hypothetical protein
LPPRHAKGKQTARYALACYVDFLLLDIYPVPQIYHEILQKTPDLNERCKAMLNAGNERDYVFLTALPPVTPRLTLQLFYAGGQTQDLRGLQLKPKWQRLFMSLD